MSESEKPSTDADGTITVDQLDQPDQGESAHSAEEGAATASSTHKAPPPLPTSAMDLPASPRPSVPPGASVPPRHSLISRLPPPPRSPAKAIGTIVLFVVLIAGAIVAGRTVGKSARAPQATSPVPASAAPTPAASDSVLMVPTIEMK